LFIVIVCPVFPINLDVAAIWDSDVIGKVAKVADDEVTFRWN
jgi:beta-glucosidase-like glycosyl hydrolase